MELLSSDTPTGAADGRWQKSQVSRTNLASELTRGVGPCGDVRKGSAIRPRRRDEIAVLGCRLQVGEPVSVALGLTQAAGQARPYNADECFHIRKHPPMRAVLSEDAVTTCVPSGLKDADQTSP
jgi:hypothetical protein